MGGIMMYDAGDIQVMVKTSEIAREEEHTIKKPGLGGQESVEWLEKSKAKVPVIRKQPKKAQKRDPTQSHKAIAHDLSKNTIL